MKIYTHQDKIPERSAIGGKAYHLYQLKKIGFQVPAFSVVDASALTSVLNQVDQDGLASMEDQIESFEWSDEMIETLHKALPPSSSKSYAVRSSAIPEDGSDHSFAGQFESYLYIPASAIPTYIKKVWKSIFSARVQTYLKEKNLPPIQQIAVIIQEMVDPDVSGVGFGVHPQLNHPDAKVICSVYGVGEGIVSGALNADTFTYQNDSWQADIVKKEEKGGRSEDGHVQYEPVDHSAQEIATLSTAQLEELRAALDQLSEAFNGPQDIEFAWSNDVMYLLQTRPITAIKNRVNENRIIWDNSNIVESYPGVTTPLTFSYIRSAYQNVYQQLAKLMGAHSKTIEANEAVFANMLGLIRGRVYYNLLSWYRVLALFPGYSLNARFMENMMGVKERFDLEKKVPMKKIPALYRTGVMLFRIIYHRITIKKTSTAFLKDVEDALAEVKSMNLEKMTAVQLKKTWIDLDALLTPKWKAPLINDSFAMIYFGRLQKFIEKHELSENPNIQNDLLCGSQDIISVEPIHKSIALATEILENPSLKELFSNHDAETVWAKIEHEPIREKIQVYLNRFGDRCVGELKLETISFKQDPTLFIKNLQSFVRQNVTTKNTQSGMDLKLREAAEKDVFGALKSRPLRKYRLKKLIAKTRYFVSNRENLRYERTRVFGITRSIFTAIGEQFENHKALNDARDIFYLTQKEVFNFIEGTAVQCDLKSLVETRKAEFDSYQNSPPPSDRITTYGTVHYGNDFYIREAPTHLADGELKGQGCCPGVVKAKIRIVHHPGDIDSLDGDILVTTSTDPGWVTLFPTASAILVERGSLLSHSAIVSREMGIPCIVGVSHLLSTLEDGEWVEMNGSTGIIKRLNHEQ